MDTKLKQRLAGAAILTILAVIFIFMLPNRGNEPAKMSAHSPNSPAFSSKVTSLDKEQQPTLHKESSRPPTDAAPAPSAAESTVDTAPSDKPSQLEAPNRPVTASASEAPTRSNAITWVVQLASFASERNAMSLRDQLRDKGYTAFVEQVDGADGKLLRVRVGPEQERAQAELLRDKLEQELKLKGIVKPYPS